MQMFCAESLLIYNEFYVTDLFDLLQINMLAGLCTLEHMYECLNQHINSMVDVLGKRYLKKS